MWLDCLWWWITEHATVLAAVVGALAASAVAWFTYTLKESTDRLASIGEKQSAILAAQTDIAIQQKEIARQQILVEHRPRLRVRHVWVHNGEHIGHPAIFFNNGADVTGSLVIVNAGGTKATVIDARYRIYFSKSGLPMKSPLDDLGQELIYAGKVFEIGDSCGVEISGKVNMGAVPDSSLLVMRQFEDEGWTIYVMGQIQYEDEGHNERFMGFCREWQGKGAFRPVDDPDYEYED